MRFHALSRLIAAVFLFSFLFAILQSLVHGRAVHRESLVRRMVTEGSESVPGADDSSFGQDDPQKSPSTGYANQQQLTNSGESSGTGGNIESQQQQQQSLPANPPSQSFQNSGNSRY